MNVASFEVLRDERVGQGGHLVIRRLELKLVFDDGARTQAGSWDYVERPMGLDAVVLAIWRRPKPRGRVEVLLRSGVRVPLWFGRPAPSRVAPPGDVESSPASNGGERRLLFTELVAGILEPGDDRDLRAIAEAREEAGLVITRVEPLGPPMFPTPGMCAELFHFLSCEVQPDAPMHPAEGDGSVFEQGARLEWVELGEALARCGRGEIQDVKTELGLRRLSERLGLPSASRESKHRP